MFHSCIVIVNGKSNSIERPFGQYSEENPKWGYKPPRPIFKSSTQASITTKDISTELRLATENSELKQKLEEAEKQIEYLKAQLFEQIKAKGSSIWNNCKSKGRVVPISTRIGIIAAQQECEEDLEFLKLEMEAKHMGDLNPPSSSQGLNNDISHTSSSYSSNKQY